ncbi:hypothetical protein K491DRAFT_316557 [Lophiostoma macrostomum CBS 122681]|uniref:Uncharacterized protein n=1 Tax=Lophiostoma macrostomum CBS 122681 TaxID=1314788 RepID=A0A6A6TFL5_9PLEO|nr:hypothetical protein K491DRAFT_316557 [Lophiostoma macrostomum CBS 122681]
MHATFLGTQPSHNLVSKSSLPRSSVTRRTEPSILLPLPFGYLTASVRSETLKSDPKIRFKVSTYPDLSASTRSDRHYLPQALLSLRNMGKKKSKTSIRVSGLNDAAGFKPTID